MYFLFHIIYNAVSSIVFKDFIRAGIVDNPKFLLLNPIVLTAIVLVGGFFKFFTCFNKI